MVALTALCILIALLLTLHACAAHIADGEELHDLTVRVHTLRNEYLAVLRGEEIIEVDVVEATDPVAGQITPDGNESQDTERQAPEPAQAA